MPSVFEVFTPTDQPTFTYVDRNGDKLEQTVRDYLSAKNAIVSISGPSKTGKTVLLRKVIEDDLLINVSGASIRSMEDFWRSVFSWMETPETVSETTTKSTEIGGAIEGSGKISIPLIADAGTSVQGNIARKSEQSKTISTYHDPFRQIVKEIGNSGFVIFIDDFHYIPRDIQTDVAKYIKALAENNVKVCTASVPHRSEDVLRANPELRGRLAAIDISYWNTKELSQIAMKGFEALNFSVEQLVVKKLVEESLGSPQLMQALCLNTCLELGIREKQIDNTKEKISRDSFARALENTSQFTNFSKLTDALHSGPKVRGAERKQFEFADRSVGDVYRAILLAIAANPAKLSFSYDEIHDRVKEQCRDKIPVGSSVVGSIGHMVEIAEQVMGEQSVLDWDDNVFTVSDPYFSFYLRSSKKLTTLK